jgi:hypothetical protein
MSDFWVIGTGQSVLRYKKEIKRLHEEKKNIFAFHRAFPDCIPHLDVLPTHWMYVDPHAAIPGLEYMLKNPDLEMKVYIPIPLVTLDDPRDLQKYAGGSVIANDPKKWASYMELLNKVRETSKSEFIEVPITTTKEILNDAIKYGPLLRGLLKPEVRFAHDKVVIGTGIFKKNDKMIWADAGDIFQENKISWCVLPFLKHIGASRAFIVGFDGLWGRFYDRNQKTKPFVGMYHFLNKWKEWQGQTGMEIYSVTECSINNHIDYIPFEDALEMEEK